MAAEPGPLLDKLRRDVDAAVAEKRASALRAAGELHAEAARMAAARRAARLAERERQAQLLGDAARAHATQRLRFAQLTARADAVERIFGEASRQLESLAGHPGLPALLEGSLRAALACLPEEKLAVRCAGATARTCGRRSRASRPTPACARTRRFRCAIAETADGAISVDALRQRLARLRPQLAIALVSASKEAPHERLGRSDHPRARPRHAPLAAGPAGRAAHQRQRGRARAAAGRAGDGARAAAGDRAGRSAARAALAAPRRRSLGLLASWAGPRIDALGPLFDEEDRRSLRALVRGVFTGQSPELRQRGLLPTPALPLRALEQLARAGDISTITAALVAWRHPFGPVLADEARRPHPQLLQLEMGLARVFAARARAVADAGDGPMALFVERTLDLSNLAAAQVLAENATDLDASTFFVAGGRLIAVDDLVFAAKCKSAIELAARLAARVEGTPLEPALDPTRRGRADALLDAQVSEFQRASLRAPLSSAPVILFLLLQRRELRAVQRILWNLALGVPQPLVERATGGAA